MKSGWSGRPVFLAKLIPVSYYKLCMIVSWQCHQIIASFWFARRMILGRFEWQFHSCAHASNLSSVGPPNSTTHLEPDNPCGEDATFDVLPWQKPSVMQIESSIMTSFSCIHIPSAGLDSRATMDRQGLVRYALMSLPTWILHLINLLWEEGKRLKPRDNSISMDWRVQK